jgi:hypothetical protein
MKMRMTFGVGAICAMFTAVCGEAIPLDALGCFNISSFNVTPIGVEINSPEALRWLDASDPLQKTVQAFLEKNAGKKLGMVIGRGNIQGIAESRITNESLKGLQWLFVDPGDTERARFVRNDQDEAEGNALKTTWPLNFSLLGVFDAVVFDFGTLKYIGDDGTEDRADARRQYFQEKMKLSVTFDKETMKYRVVDGAGRTENIQNLASGIVSKDSFPGGLCFFNLWLEENNPPELQPLKQKYDPIIAEEDGKIAEARARQKEVLKKGLKDAYTSLRAGGTLIIPSDGTIRDLSLTEILGAPDDDLRTVIVDNPNELGESPILPQNSRGMGTSYSAAYFEVKAKKDKH